MDGSHDIRHTQSEIEIERYVVRSSKAFPSSPSIVRYPHHALVRFYAADNEDWFILSF